MSIKFITDRAEGLASYGCSLDARFLYDILHGNKIEYAGTLEVCSRQSRELTRLGSQNKTRQGTYIVWSPGHRYFLCEFVEEDGTVVGFTREFLSRHSVESELDIFSLYNWVLHKGGNAYESGDFSVMITGTDQDTILLRGKLSEFTVSFEFNLKGDLVCREYDDIITRMVRRAIYEDMQSLALISTRPWTDDMREVYEAQFPKLMRIMTEG